MSKENSIVIKKTYDIAKPAEIVEMATTLKTYIVKQRLFTDIKGKNYAHVDGWQFAGFLVGMSAAIDEDTNLSSEDGKEIKWKSVAYLYERNKDGEYIKTPFRGDAVCSNKEATKKGFDEYAVLSMAQTRAIGKAYRNRMGWVMKLAGYEATPSEEMRKVDQVPSEPVIHTDAPPVAASDNTDYVCHGARKGGCGNDLTKQEYDFSKKVYGKPLCRTCQKDVKPKK